MFVGRGTFGVLCAALLSIVACGGDKGSAPGSEGATQAWITAEQGGSLAAADGLFTLAFGPSAVSADALVVVSPATSAAGTMYQVASIPPVTVTSFTVTLAVPGGATSEWAIGFSSTGATGAFEPLTTSVDNGALVATATAFGAFMALPPAGGAACDCDTTDACDTGCGECDPDCGTVVDPASCTEMTIPGKDEVIEPTTCTWTGVVEPGAGGAGSYDHLCDQHGADLHQTAFEHELDLLCLAHQADVGLASFVLDDGEPEYGIAYLWVDDALVGRITLWNHGIALTSCGLPHPDAKNLALAEGWHDWRVEAFESESCTLYNNGGNVICGDGFDPEASLVARWENSVHVGKGGCAQVLVGPEDRVAGGGGGGGCVHEGSLTISDSNVGEAAGVCEIVNGTLSIGVSSGTDLDMTKLTHVGGDIAIKSAGLVALADGATIDGNLRINGSATIDSFEVRLTGLAEVAGDVDIGHNKVTGVVLESLATIGGTLRIDGKGLQSADFPALVAIEATDEVAAMTVLNAQSLASLSLPELVTANGNVTIATLPLLDELSFPTLETISGFLAMDHDDALTVASFPALQTMGGMLRVEANPALETLEMPALTRIEAEEFDHAIRITQCESLQEAAFPALEEVVGSISLEVLDSLLAIDLSSLATVTRYISIKKAPSLTELSLDALVDVEGLVVRETSLDQCVIDELTDKLGIDCDCFDNAGSCN